MKNAKSELDWNIKTHDRLAKEYERMHGEIYNDIEQKRLSLELRMAISHITTNSSIKVALDFGCGAGNLTRHISNLGCEVIAADVSQGFLNLVSSNSYKNNVKTIKLNGKDLSNLPDKSVDMVATYSVLHHIPDYLGILHEFMRILKPGGIIYIDHEPSTEFWTKNKLYKDFTLQIKKKTSINLKKYINLENYYDWIVRKFINPRYHREGDIHVFEDDHVEWIKVINILMEAGAEVILSKSYLLYRRGFDITIYSAYQNKITDMHVLVMKKND